VWLLIKGGRVVVNFLVLLVPGDGLSGAFPQFVQVFDSDFHTVQFTVWTVVRLTVAR